MSNDMASWGWDEGWGSTLRATLLAEPALAAAAEEGRLVPGRVIADSRGLFQVAAGPGIAWSRPTGKLWDRIADTTEVPVTGDWVVVEPDGRADKWPLHAVLPRRGTLSRQAPTDERHAAREHVLAANVDVLLMVFGLDGGRNFTERGLERLATIAWQSGATPVVVLNKADLAEDLAGAEARAREAAPGRRGGRDERGGGGRARGARGAAPGAAAPRRSPDARAWASRRSSTGSSARRCSPRGRAGRTTCGGGTRPRRGG